MDLAKPDQQSLTALSRISLQALNQAADVLSGLLRQPIRIDAAGVWRFDCEALAEQQPDPALGIFMTLAGDVNGGLLLTFSEQCAVWMSESLLETHEIRDLLLEPASSTLKEVGNIFASAFLVSLDEQLGLCALPSPPQLARTAASALLGDYCRKHKNPCMVLRTTLVGAPEGQVHGTIYLLLESSGLDRLLAGGREKR